MRQSISVLFLSIVVFTVGIAGVTFGAVPATTSGQSASVTFNDQESNGTTVEVDSVHLEDGGFVTIYCAVCGFRGASEYLEPGTHENITVELENPINQERPLVAVAYRDANGDQTFNEDEDTPYRVDGGRVSSNASVTVVEDAAAGDDEPKENETDDSETADNETEGTESDEVNETADAAPTDEVVTVDNETGNVTIQNATILSAIFVNSTIEQFTVENSTIFVVAPTDNGDLRNVTENGETNVTDENGEELNVTEENVSEEDAADSFTVSSLEVTEVSEENETVTLQAEVHNPNEVQTTQDVDLRVNGDVAQTISLTLDANESALARFQVDTEDLQEGPQILGIYTDRHGENVLIRLSDASEGDQNGEQ